MVDSCNSSSKIQLESMKDMEFILNNIGNYVNQQIPGQESIIEEMMNKLLPRLAGNIEISGIPYDMLLQSGVDCPASFEEYEKLDYEAEEKLKQILETFEDELQDFISLRKTMPDKICQANQEKSKAIHHDDFVVWEAEAQASLLEKEAKFGQYFEENFGPGSLVHLKEDGEPNKLTSFLSALKAQLSSHSHIEKDLPALISKFSRAKQILNEEIEATQKKSQDQTKSIDGEASDFSDTLWLGIQAAQRRLQELNSYDPEQDNEDEDADDAENLSNLQNLHGKAAPMPKKRKRLSLIEKQVEMKDQIHAMKMFLSTLSATN